MAVSGRQKPKWYFERAVSFRRDVLGLPFLFAAPPRLAFFDCGGVQLMLSAPEPGFDHPGSVLYFAVEDIRRETGCRATDHSDHETICID